MRRISSFTLLTIVAVLGCSDQDRLPSSNRSLGSARLAQQLDAENASHLLVIASYEKGVFRAEQVTRVPGALIQPRSGKQRGLLTYRTRKGTSALTLGGLPDPREVHVDSPTSGSARMSKVSIEAPGKQHFIIHVPASAETIDFYDTAILDTAVPAPSNGPATAMAAAASTTPIGSISLSGLL